LDRSSIVVGEGANKLFDIDDGVNFGPRRRLMRSSGLITSSSESLVSSPANAR
jgi:hypothetical protein